MKCACIIHIRVWCCADLLVSATLGRRPTLPSVELSVYSSSCPLHLLLRESCQTPLECAWVQEQSLGSKRGTPAQPEQKTHSNVVHKKDQVSNLVGVTTCEIIQNFTKTQVGFARINKEHLHVHGCWRFKHEARISQGSACNTYSICANWILNKIPRLIWRLKTLPFFGWSSKDP